MDGQHLPADPRLFEQMREHLALLAQAGVTVSRAVESHLPNEVRPVEQPREQGQLQSGRELCPQRVHPERELDPCPFAEP
jgi:hypothetical protein